MKKIFYKFHELVSRYRSNIKVHSSIDALMSNSFISKALQDKTPYLIGRIGWMEGYAIGKLLAEGETPLALREKLMMHAGVFPATPEELQKFTNITLAALEDVDMLGLLGAPYHGWLIKKYAAKAELTALDSLEPYFSDTPWSWELRGKRVLVVHPFSESITKQYETVREKIFKNPKMLPQFELNVIKAPQTITGNKTEYSTWTETLHALEEQVRKEEFDVALIGCGAYGLPLAAAVKKMGKIGIHLGGATQLLFGIRGRRWAEHPAFLKYQSLMTEAWSSPLECERPQGWKKIEEGCYW